MKYRLVIILLIFMFVGSAGNAQTFRDSNNMQLGKVERSSMMEPSGTVTT